jgi:hypothetical protein
MTDTPNAEGGPGHGPRPPHPVPEGGTRTRGPAVAEARARPAPPRAARLFRLPASHPPLLRRAP